MIYSKGYGTYVQAHKNSLKGRALEGEALLKVVYLFKEAKNFPGKKKRLYDAIDYTRKLWLLIESDIDHPANKTAPRLKERLRSMARYVDDRCVMLSRRTDLNAMQNLMDIHQEMAQGLLGTGDAAN